MEPTPPRREWGWLRVLDTTYGLAMLLVGAVFLLIALIPTSETRPGEQPWISIIGIAATILGIVAVRRVLGLPRK